MRILLVDDFGSWRRLVAAMLRHRPELEIICESSDGSEAVQKAEELLPDLILIDIGLPTLNGLEAAQQIRAFSPTSKIIITTQEKSVDVVLEAFRAGADGYVVKVDAGTELLTAIDAVFQGERFVGRRFSGLAIPEPSEESARVFDEISSYSITLPNRSELLSTGRAFAEKRGSRRRA